MADLGQKPKKHLLIVDDEDAIRDLLKEALAMRGYRTTAVSSAIEADRAIGEDPPDLIISDLQLEESDGLDMVARLKARVPDTPILLLTGVFFDATVVRDTLGKHVSAYLHKTSTLDRIVEEVKRLLAK
ncbi:MAG TPA: response regulator [Opitutaceae bacterium]|jgi:two-component system nitrogen regulation response regulator GlnG